MKRHISFLLIIVFVFMSLFGCTDSENSFNHRLQWWLSDIGWDQNRNSLTGKGIRIAVIDSGIDCNTEIKHAILMNEKSVTEPTDFNEDLSHGTAIANIIAAIPKDEKSVLGVAVGAKIISIDVTNNSDGKVDVSDLVQGIKIALKSDVDIINISVGVFDENDELRAVVSEAIKAGIIVIASAGNFMKDALLFPAAYDDVIAVGSKSKTGEIISPIGSVENEVIFLPGENIVTATGENEYVSVYGTSASCAIMSGIAALILEHSKKNITPYEFKKIISGLFGKTDLTVEDFKKSVE